jgi:hypothetical protein
MSVIAGSPRPISISSVGQPTKLANFRKKTRNGVHVDRSSLVLEERVRTANFSGILKKSSQMSGDSVKCREVIQVLL